MNISLKRYDELCVTIDKLIDENIELKLKIRKLEQENKELSDRLYEEYNVKVMVDIGR